ncbi:MAG: type II toxin-antitoxin system VapC family toxin [Chloroflexota bacterium]
MRFWDTSAIIPLVLDDVSSTIARRALASDSRMVVWWAASVECTAAIARAERDRRIDPPGTMDALAGLRLLHSGWLQIDATARLREVAERLTRSHPLRAVDALQLAAATVAAEGRPASLPFVTLDDRLALAADREGFPVVRFEATST